jgi:choice-of-anchor C domain-containing protein
MAQTHPSATRPTHRFAAGLAQRGAAAWAGLQACLRSDVVRPLPQRLLVLLLPVLLLVVAYVRAQSAGVVNDAHSYIDEFNDNTGIELPSSSGFQNFGGRLDATAATMTVVSNCFALPQPAGGTFDRWLFAEIGLANLTSVTSSSLQVQTCAGAVLATFANPAAGTRSYDISSTAGTTPSIRFVYTATHSGVPGGGVVPARLDFWRAYGQASGAVQVTVVPSRTSAGHNDAVTMSLNISTNGAVARNAVLTFSMDDINGLAANGSAVAPDDGLNEDAEADYGNGGGLRVYRPVTLNNAGNAPDGSPPTSTVAGNNRGTLSWALGNLPSGYTGTVSVTLRVPIGFVNGRTFAARARLSHGAVPVNALPGLQTTQTAVGTSPTVSVSGNSNWIQTSYSPFSNVAPGATGVWRDFRPYLSTFATSGMDAENARVTIEFDRGSCTPIFRSFVIQNAPPAEFTHRLVSAPAANAPATTPLVYHFDRLPWNSYGGGATPTRVTPTFDIPASCADGSQVSLRLTVDYGNPARTVTATYNHPVVVNYCRAAGTGGWVHRQANAGVPTWAPWPAWTEYYITGGSVRAGEFFSVWLYGAESNASHTVTLDRSYYLITVPSWLTFHGLTTVNNTSRIFKDSTGTAPLPNDPAFVHAASPPHPAWRPVTATDIGSTPFSAAPNDSNPSAVVGPGTRLLFVRENDHPRTTGPSFGSFNPEALFRVADGSYGVPEQAEGTANTGFLPGRVYTWETQSNPAGVARDCGNFNSSTTMTKESVSWPRVLANFDGRPNVAAGQTASLNLYPENRKWASAPVRGVWVVNLFDARDRVNLGAVAGSVNTAGRTWPPGANPGGIVFTPPNPSACLAALNDNDPACMARWEVPENAQPAPAYGERDAQDADRDNIIPYPVFNLQLPILRNAPAGVPLPVRFEVRRTDLSARGADNAVATARHGVGNYTVVQNVTVLEAPELATTLNAPSSWPHNNRYTLQLQLENRGNAASQGFYSVLRLPRAGVGGSAFTPGYGRAYLSGTASELLLETSTEATCLSNPVGGTWVAQPLQASARSGYLAQTTADLPAATTCLRVRRNAAGAYNFLAGRSLSAAVDLDIPNNPGLSGQSLVARAASGSHVPWGSSTAFGPLETADTTTQVSSVVVTGGTKAALADLTRAGWVRWTLRWSNQSGSAASNVSVTDTLPPELIYRGLASALPAGVSCLDAGCAAVSTAGDGSGGLLRLRVASLAPNDGAAGSGADEGSVDVWMQRKPGVADGADIQNCLTTAPAGLGNIGSNACTGIGNGRLGITLIQTVTPDQGGTPPQVSPNDLLRYTLAITHQEASGRFLRVHDALPAEVTYVPGSFQVNGATASDAAFDNGVLSYVSTALVAPGTPLTLQYEVRVRSSTTNGTLVTNTAVATPCTSASELSSCSLGKESPSVQAQVVASAGLSGVVFEDANYGGGAGRSRSASAGVGRPGVRVELYDAATGSLQASTTTASDGSYSFSGLGANTWNVRVVGASVTSARSGSSPALRGVMTWRTRWDGTAHVGDGNRVGGEAPGRIDAPQNTGTQTLGAINAVTGQVAQYLATARTTVGTVTGIDIGFNFNTVVNTNDSGPGSLRQVITNANTLGGDATLTQAGRLAGTEHVIFMLGNGSSAAGLNSAHNFFTTNGGTANVATINLLSGLPGFGALTVDAQTQPGWNSASPRPIIELNGTATPSGTHGLLLTSGATVRGFIINRFSERQIHLISGGGGGNLVQGNWLGLDATGTAAPATVGVHGISVQSPFNVIGGTTAAQRNVASGNASLGIVLETSGATGNRVIGNYAGTNAAGTSAVGNGAAGIGVYLSASGNQIGGAATGEGNLVSGNPLDGVSIAGSSGNTVQGNRIGTNADGTAAVGNARRGVHVQGGSNNTIGGSAASQGNLISGNGTSLSDEAHAAIVVNGAATGVVIAGNTVGLAADRSTALGNRKNSIFIADQSAVTVGGTTTAHRNLIAAAHSHGVLVYRNGTAGVTVQNNWIGLAADGSTARGNGLDGVVVWNGSSSNVNVLNNVIAGQGRYGVWFSNGTGHAVRGNLIGTDSTGNARRPNGHGIYISDVNNVTIGGPTAADRNVISGNTNNGIWAQNSSGHSIRGNYIGLNADGSLPLGNGSAGNLNGAGIRLENTNNTQVGGTTAAERNVISANLVYGLLISGTDNTVQGNYFGTDASNAGSTGLGNGDAVRIFSANNRIGGTDTGAGNVIRNSTGKGINISGTSTSGNRIQRNAIFGNAGLGIDLDDNNIANPNNGSTSSTLSNNGIDHPVISSASLNGDRLTIAGHVGSAPGQSSFGGSTVEVFVSDQDSGGFGEGQAYIGSLTADGSGNFSGTVTVPVGVTLLPGTTRLTATATDTGGNTSEFGANFLLPLSITGTVFEDVNYGGGAGRSLAASNGVPRPGATVELYTVSGSTATFRTSTSTDSSGLYAFNGLTAGSYAVRVVDSTVTSSRNGQLAGLLPVPTAWYDWTANAAVPVTDRVGGISPAAASATAGSTGATFDTSTGTFNAGPSGTAQAFTRVTLSSANASGLDFGYSFSTVVNTHDSGQGSLRQALVNAVTDAGAQRVVFNIPSTDANYASGVWTITPATALPQVTDTTLIDASTQPGYVGVPLVQIRGTLLGAAANGFTLSGAAGSAVRGFVLNGFPNCAIELQAPGGHTAAGNYVGTAVSGTTAAANGEVGICVHSHGNTVGGTGTNDRNVVGGFVDSPANSGNGRGIRLTFGAANNVIVGNYVGIGADGITPVGNRHGVLLVNAANNRIGGTSATERNVISGNLANGIFLDTWSGPTSATLIQGNRIGTNAAGTAAVPNAGDGVLIQGSTSSTTIGGTAAGAGNLISGNAGRGVAQNAAGVTTTLLQGNWIGLNAAGEAAIANASGGVAANQGGSMRIGGTAPGAGNVISGNTGAGVLLSGNGHTVVGNRIGTNAAGTAAVGNSLYGVHVTGSNNVIGGADAGAGNVLSGNGENGVLVSGFTVTGTVVQGNIIGLNALGTAAVPNGTSDSGASSHGGIRLHNGASNTSIGGASAGQGNVIAGNRLAGVVMRGGSQSTQNTVQGNRIGVNAAGTVVANGGYGVIIDNGSGPNTLGGVGIGEGNIIRGHGAGGVYVGGDTSRNAIRGNSIYGNDTNIRLSLAGAGANDGAKPAGTPNLMMDTPVITRAVLGSNTVAVVGYVGSAALQGVFGGALVDVYVADNTTSQGGSAAFIGTLTANADGEFAGVLSTAGLSGLAAGTARITATATDVQGNTSEFGTAATTVALAPLANGGFETGADPGAFTVLPTGNSGGMPGWTVTGHSVDYMRSWSQPAEGARSVDLSGDNRGGIAQIVQTTPGQTYTVSFSLAGGFWGTPVVKTLRVTAGSTVGTLSFDSMGRTATAMGWVDRSLTFTATAEATVLWFESLDASNGGPILDQVRLTLGAAPVASLSGTVFEDLNYGGGAGRPRASAAGNSPRPGARVELFDASGNFVTSTTTDASGTYSFTNRTPGNYTVRVVNSSVSSSRSGGSASAVPTVVYRTDATNSSAIPDPNFVGGANPLLNDAGNGSTTLAALTSASATAQAITPVTLAGDITGLDFGFSFNVVTNAQDTGSGSLRQAITNANTLAGDTSLAQAGRVAGMEHIVFMLPNGTAGNGLRSGFNAFTTSAGSYNVATLTPASALPNVTTPMVLDAQTQPGWTLEPRIEISGSSMGGASRAIEFANGSAGSRLAGFVINRVASGMAVYVSTGATGVVIQGNWMGVNAAGTAAAPNGVSNLVLAAAGAAALNATVGGTTAAQRNVISGSAVHGVLLESSGNTVTGNYIGTNAAGTAAIGNSSGVRIRVGASNNTIGGSAAGAGNLISGNGDKGVWLSETSSADNVVAGNIIGLNAAGTAALPNGNSGVNVGGAVGTVIGGTTAAHGNLIAGNGSAGVALTSHIGSTASTTVRFNTIGLDAAGTARPNSVGIVIDAGSGGHTIADNTISGNTGHGIQATVAGAGTSITGNRIGTTADGTAARGNGATGVYLAGTASGYSLGGTAAGAGNLISGNALHGVHLVAGATGISVQGNLIGTNAAGTAALPNLTQGVLVDASGITIGGTAAGARNLISGNGQAGVRINGSNVVVQGNYIGTNAAGTAAVANGSPSAANGGVWLANGSGALIGGGSTAARNVISGNGGAGIWVESAGASGAVIQGNHIGTNAAGDAAVSNGRWGIVIFGSGVQVGGTAAGAGNLVSGNTAGNAGGIYITGNSNIIEGNRIGTNAAGTGFIANGSVGGIEVRSGNDNRVGGTAAGAGNLVAGNNGVGVAVNTGALQNAVLGNRIHGNTGIGIDVGGGVGGSHPGATANDGATTAGASNLLMDHPVFTAAALAGGELFISGYIGTAPNDTDFANARVEVFVSDNDAGGFGEGHTYLGFVTADASGNFSGRLTVPGGVTITPGTTRVTGTATDTANNTSEFGANVTVTAGISGRVYEDLNYGGGAGRNWAAASANGAVSRPNVRVEYGIVSGGVVTVQGFVTTAADGSYIVPTTGAGTFAVRVPTAGVPSSRSGSIAGLLPVLTYMAEAPGGSLLARADRVGGISPADSEAGTASAGAAFSSTTGVFSSGAAGTAQAFALVQVSASAAIAGIDFGFNFNTVVNTNDSGAGSLRQVITNANTLGGDGSLAVAGREAGREHVVFMISNGTTGAGGSLSLPAGGLRAGINYFTTAGAAGNVATINALSVFTVSSSLVVDAQTQPGWLLEPRLEIRGDAVPSTTAGLVELTGGPVTVRGLVLNRHLGQGIRAVGGVSGHVIQGCWIGVTADGTAAGAIRLSSIWISGGGSNHVIGGTLPAQRNVLSGTTQFEGLAIGGGSGHLIQGNFIGTNAAGTAAVATQSWGIRLYSGVTNSTIGGTTAGAGNVVSGSQREGIYVAGSGITLQGNSIGTNAVGTAALPNVAGGLLIEGSNHVIGGSVEGAGNLISGNGGSGIALSGSGHTVQGNTVGLQRGGATALPNATAGLLVGGSNITVGGSTALERNLISGNTGWGVEVSGSGNVLRGNHIGLNAAGTAGISNNGGVRVTGSSNTIGGASSAEGNVITGRTGVSYGLVVAGPDNTVRFNRVGTNAAGTAALDAPYYCMQLAGTTNNLVRNNQIAGCNLGLWLADGSGHQILGNLIGTDAAGTGAIGNVGEAGIMVTNTASNLTIGTTTTGDANTIANNSVGVAVRAASPSLVPSGIRISGNRMFGNLGLGIDLWTGYDGGHVGGVTPNDGAKTGTFPNRLMDHPVFTSARARGSQLTVAGYVGSTAGQGAFANARVEIFESDGDATGFGEGRTYLGFVTTDASGNFSGTLTLPVAALRVGTRLTGTATDSDGNTSEFGPNFDGLVVDLVVNHNGDAADANLGDGYCATAAGVCTLRAAIGEFNLLPPQAGGTPTVAFALPGCSASTQPACTLSPASVLPTVSVPMRLDAQTQPGWTQAPLVVINGASAGSVHGLNLAAPGAGVHGFVIHSFSAGAGINVQSTATQARIGGNWIGLDGGGASAGNQNGLNIDAAQVQVGGNTAAQRNVIGSNSSQGIAASGASVVIRGNHFGLAPDGLAGRANGSHGIRGSGAFSATIGGSEPGEGNVFGSSVLDALALDGTGGTLQGNLIGLAADGTTLRSSRHGIYLMSGNWVVGGTGAGEPNTITGHRANGVLVNNGARATLRANRIVGNTLLGIDLGHNGASNSGVGDGVTANNGTVNTSRANHDIDHPVITGVGIANAGNAMTAYGYIGTGTGQAAFNGARVEFFVSDADGSGFGEGRRYLGSLTADANGRFSGTFPITVGDAVVGDVITATATDSAGNTSEFGPNWTSTTMAGLSPAGFNAFDSDTPAGQTTGPLRSRVAGAATSLDILALDSAGTGIHPGFNGAVTLNWLDARDDSGALSGSCRSSWSTLGNAGTATFASGSRVTVSNLVLPPTSTRVMRLQIVYAGPTGTVRACSTDAFAALPSQLAWVNASDADSGTAGTARVLDNANASGGVVHRAGRPFTLRARALDATGALMTGYDGSPQLSLAGCALPSTGCVPGALGGGSVSAVGGLYTHSSVTYSEVGAVRVRLADTSYATVDAGDPSPAPSALDAGELTVGRFVPDTFQVSVTRAGRLATGNVACLAAGSASTFYGQAFGWQTAPQLTVTALNATGDITRNWSGSLMKLTPSAVVQQLAATGSGSATLSSSWGSVSVSALGNGTARLESDLSDRFALVLPAQTQQSVRTPSWSYAAAVADTSESGVAGNPSPGGTVTDTSVHLPSGGSFVSGRLSLAAAQGDARSGVRALVQLQRWTDAGWVTMTEDQGCVTIAPENLAFADPSGVFATAGVCAAPVTGSVTTRGGRAWLALPGTPGGASGRLRLQLAGDGATGQACAAGSPTTPQPLPMSWLLGGPGAAGPSGLATWGLPRREPTLRREFW